MTDLGMTCALVAQMEAGPGQRAPTTHSVTHVNLSSSNFL